MSTNPYDPTNTMSFDEQESFIDTFLEAARDGKLDTVKRCISKGIDANATKRRGACFARCTALWYALINGHSEIIKYLIEKCHVDTERVYGGGFTALHIASSDCSMEIVQYLIETCRVDTEAKDKLGRTALHHASLVGRLNVVQYLIEICNVNKKAKDAAGWTALHIASYNGQLETVQYFIESGYLDKEAQDNDGCTALHLASGDGHLEVVKYLVETCHVDKEIEDNDSRTPLDHASDTGNVEIANYLVEKCYIDATDKCDRDNEANIDDGLTVLYLLDLIEQKHAELDAMVPPSPFKCIMSNLLESIWGLVNEDTTESDAEKHCEQIMDTWERYFPRSDQTKKTKQ